jgi:hypothetical protein
MSVQETTCPECGVKTTAWVGGLQTPEQRNLERACAKHREMYKAILDEAKDRNGNKLYKSYYERLTK